jgi:hypothetical protein
MNNHFTLATILEREDAHVLVCERYIRPAPLNSLSDLEQTYQFVRVELGKQAFVLCFDHPANIGGGLFTTIPDVRSEILSRFPAWSGDTWYIGAPYGRRYVYARVDFIDDGWPMFSDDTPTSSLAHQYGLSFEALNQLVLELQKPSTVSESA